MLRSTVLMLLVAAAPLTAQDYAFRDVTVIPINTPGSLQHQTVIVRGDRIVEIGATSKVHIPAGATIVDGRGKFLMPGLIDMHAHFYTSTSIPEQAKWNTQLAPLLIANGVTTVFNMRGSPTVLDLRSKITNGSVVGPTMVTTGRLLNDTAMTFEGGQKIVEEQKADGYDALKIYANLSKAGFDGASEASRRLGMKMVGHIPQRVGTFHVLDGGQSLISHIEEFLYNPPFHLFYSDPNPPSLEIDSIPRVIAAVKKAGAYVSPTLIAYKTILLQATNLQAVLEDSVVTRSYTPDMMKAAGWYPEQNNRAKRLGGDEARRRLTMGLEFQRRMVHDMHAAGIPLLAGTDIGLAGITPGTSLVDELHELVQAGLSTYESLKTATSNAARFLSMDVGVVQTGKRADLLLLDADPLADVLNTKRISGVMLRGKWIDAQTRAAMMTTRVGAQ